MLHKKLLKLSEILSEVWSILIRSIQTTVTVCLPFCNNITSNEHIIEVMFQSFCFACITGASALCRWLKCSNANVWREWGDNCTSLLCQPWVKAFLLYISYITGILHVTWWSFWCTEDQRESIERSDRTE
jgi:hypothetical protein